MRGVTKKAERNNSARNCGDAMTNVKPTAPGPGTSTSHLPAPTTDCPIMFRPLLRSSPRLTALRNHIAPPLVKQYTQFRTMSVPTTMKAVVVEQTGGPEVLQLRTSHPVPTPQAGQLLVRNNISGVNFIDTYFRTGLYPAPKPEVLGREGAGVVAAVGPETSGFQVGDRVAWLATGGYAEYTAVPAAKSVKIPEGISDEDVMASFLSGLTVLSFVKETYPVQKGDWVLFHAAAGGAGFLAVQILKTLGAKVIGTAGGAEKCALVKSLGADVVIDYRSEEGKDWVKHVKEATGGRGVDVVYDSVGKDTWEGSLEAVKRKGTIVWFGNASGPVPPIALPYVHYFFAMFFVVDADDISIANFPPSVSKSLARPCSDTLRPARSTSTTPMSCSIC
jgi:NADPH2:quinone reductase